MSRRLLGPVGGSIIYCLVGALVFAGLGWVTYAALGVEQAQREAHARAEIGNSLRVALWRLDGRMLPTLGVEDSRPFYHYSPPDPAATPLLGANLPDWMKLHFELDAANGWSSPQVVEDAELAERVRRAWPDDVPPRHLNGWRTEFLKADLKAKFPSEATCELFAKRDREIPADSGPFAVPQFIGEVTPPQSEPAPTPAPAPPAAQNPKPGPAASDPVSVLPPVTTDPHDTIRVFGFEFCLRDGHEKLSSNQQVMSDPRQELQVAQSAQKKSAEQTQVSAPLPHHPPQPQPGNSMTFRNTARSGQKDLDNNPGWLDYMSRAGTVGRAAQEAKQTGVDPIPARGMYSQNQGFPVDPKNVGNLNSFPGLNYKNDANTLPIMPQTTGLPPTLPPGAAPLPPGSTTHGAVPLPPGPAPVVPATGQSLAPPSPAASVSGGPGGVGLSFDNTAKDKATRDLAKLAKVLESDSKPLGGLVAETAKSLTLNREKGDTFKDADAAIGKRKQPLGDTADEFGRLLRLREEVQERAAAANAIKGAPTDTAKAKGDKTLPIAPPSAVGEDRPVPPAVVVPTAVVPPSAAFPQHAIHLGSMRPQWLTAPDGSEMLVLVRTAKYDNQSIYQGVILDWVKLQAALKDEVKDLFPDAKLVPVKDPDGVSPDRAMTALPVQLDVGPEPTLRPAGWTPLRIGLLLAWVAAIIAFAAVGFSGWSLIDLAERRIRFVSAVTHELRTPLTSLRLYLDLLVSGMVQDEAKKQEYLNTLALESDRLHRLIDNVLDFAKLEKRRKNGDIKPVKVNELLDQLGATWTERVALDGKELVVISTLTADQEIRTDSAMIQQIVANLIDNARKYTRDAADKRIWLWAKPGPGNSISIEVEDRGTGVPANERRSIFKPFRRGEHAESTAGGAGLGLALAKSWAEVLGATLSYRPADGGVGACFRLELPGT